MNLRNFSCCEGLNIDFLGWVIRFRELIWVIEFIILCIYFL